MVSGVCQVFSGLFGVFLLTGAAGAVAVAAPATPERGLRVEPWHPSSFSDLVLEQPDLASEVLLNPGWFGEAAVPGELPDQAALAAALGQQLAGLGPLASLEGLRIVVAETPADAPVAFARPPLVFVLAPARLLGSVEQLARVVAPALVVGTLRPAPPEEGVSEPLLEAASALVAGGVLTLAALPPALRPVSGWTEKRDVATTLDRFFADALDEHRAWSSRRATLLRFQQPGGAPPAVGTAAAFLLELLAPADRGVSSSPMDLLRHWRSGRHPGLPAAPAVLRRALAAPAQAGVSRRGEHAGDRRLMEMHALERLVATGNALPPPPEGGDVPTSLRLLAAAHGRARGDGGVCSWLAQAVIPEGVRTGCPGERPDGGVVFVRARRGGGSEVVSRGVRGDEVVVLLWPRWALFPVVVPSRNALQLLDEQGLWEFQLEGGEPPRLILPGSFRHLAVSPSGRRSAVVDWPEGGTVVVSGDDRHDLAVAARGGLVWLDEDVLLVSSGDGASLVSLDGSRRPFPLDLECVRLLSGRGETVLVSTGTPCAPAILRVSLSSAAVTASLPVAGGSGGAALLADGSVVFAAADGLSRWLGGEQVERLAVGLTPGPG